MLFVRGMPIHTFYGPLRAMSNTSQETVWSSSPLKHHHETEIQRTIIETLQKHHLDDGEVEDTQKSHCKAFKGGVEARCQLH
jgi:hypothetical protein